MFSGVVSSLFGALLNGASIYPFDLQRASPTDLAAWANREDITIYHSVPSIFRQLGAGADYFPTIRLIRLEGDQAGPQDVVLFNQRFTSDCILVHGLGATECGLVRQYFIDQSTPFSKQIVPLGYPVEDMEIRLLSEAGEAVAVGDIGEIVVRSEYLAQGYWRQPELTKAAFRVDKEHGGRAAVLYRRSGSVALRRVLVISWPQRLPAQDPWPTR